MMLARVRGIYTIDHDDLEAYVPNDPVECHMFVRVMVGPHDGEGEESFDVTVCTPAWLGRRPEERGAVIGRHYLIVGRYDPELIRRVLTKQLERSSGTSREDLAAKLRRIGSWEFDDYVDRAPKNDL
jgi:hypothetical protein